MGGEDWSPDARCPRTSHLLSRRCVVPSLREAGLVCVANRIWQSEGHLQGRPQRTVCLLFLPLWGPSRRRRPAAMEKPVWWGNGAPPHSQGTEPSWKWIFQPQLSLR